MRLARSDATPGVIVSNEAGEQAPLLRAHAAETDGTKKEHAYGKAALRYTAALVFVVATGTAAWLMSKHGETNDSPRRPKDVIEWKSQVIGWTSAALYCELPLELCLFCLTAPRS